MVGTPAAEATPGRRQGSPVLVGRDTELSEAVAVVTAPPAVVVVEGEAGIGKTRLVTALRGYSAVADRRFLVGACRPIREPFPLGPVLEAVREIGDDRAAAELSPVAGALRPLLPEIADRLPPPLPPLGDWRAEQHRVFRALVELLGAAGAAVLVVEDLHWADDHTVDFLGYLLGAPPGGLSLVLTFRGEEVAPAVRALTSRLPAKVTSGHVTVAPLDPTQTGALAAGILGVEKVSAEFAGHLCARASGVPFAVEELLALLRSRGSLVPYGQRRWARRTLEELDVPTRIRDSVLERVSRLSADGRAVLAGAAVLHLAVDVRVMVETCGLTESQARAGLAEALESGLLTWQGDRVGFRHVLATQAAYGDLPPLKRRELHARAAAAVESLRPVPLGQLAHHLREAGRIDAWVAAAEQAADQAVELGDHHEAVRLLEPVLRHVDLPLIHRARLTVKLGWAAAETVRPAETGLSDLFAAALAWPQDLPAELRGEMRFLNAVELERVGDEAAGREVALAVEDLDGQPELQALAMIGLAQFSTPARSPSGEHAGWLDRGLAAIGRIDDPSPRLLGKAAALLCIAGDPQWRVLTGRIRARAATEAGDVTATNALCAVAYGACYAGHHRAAAELLRAAEAATVGTEVDQSRLQCIEIFLSYCCGRWQGLAERARQFRDELHADRPVLRQHADIVIAGLALATGEVDAAATSLGKLVGSEGDAVDVDVLPVAQVALIRLELARGNAGAVLPALASSVAAWEAYPLLAPAVRALPWVVEAMLASGPAGEAAALVGRWAGLLRGRDAPLAPAALRQARASLAAASGRERQAGALFSSAAQRYDQLWCPYESAQAYEQAARCWSRAGDERALPAIRAALAGYQQLGAAWDLGRAASLARRHGVPTPRRHGGGRRSYGAELSPREREVAELVATGRTNREIARELYLSPKTVGKHISAALHKLDLPTRAALAHHIAGAAAPTGGNYGELAP